MGIEILSGSQNLWKTREYLIGMAGDPFVYIYFLPELAWEKV